LVYDHSGLWICSKKLGRTKVWRAGSRNFGDEDRGVGDAAEQAVVVGQIQCARISSAEKPRPSGVWTGQPPPSIARSNASR
jgi:hypothetical protein